MDLISSLPRPQLLGRALIWPGHFGATTFGLFGLYPSSLSTSAGLVSLAGKASMVSISMVSYFYDPSMFIYRWSSNFVEKVLLERMHGRQDAISCLLPCLLYYMESEFKQIITKIRLSIN